MQGIDCLACPAVLASDGSASGAAGQNLTAEELYLNVAFDEPQTRPPLPAVPDSSAAAIISSQSPAPPTTEATSGEGERQDIAEDLCYSDYYFQDDNSLSPERKIEKFGKSDYAPYRVYLVQQLPSLISELSQKSVASIFPILSSLATDHDVSVRECLAYHLRHVLESYQRGPAIQRRDPRSVGKNTTDMAVRIPVFLITHIVLPLLLDPQPSIATMAMESLTAAAQADHSSTLRGRLKKWVFDLLTVDLNEELMRQRGEGMGEGHLFGPQGSSQPSLTEEHENAPDTRPESNGKPTRRVTESQEGIPSPGYESQEDAASPGLTGNLHGFGRQDHANKHSDSLETPQPDPPRVPEAFDNSPSTRHRSLNSLTVKFLLEKQHHAKMTYGNEGRWNLQDLHGLLLSLVQVFMLHITAEDVERAILPKIEQLVGDSSIRIRRECALCLMVCTKIPQDEVIQRVIPLFDRLANDRVWNIRRACSEVLPTLFEVIPDVYKSGWGVVTVDKFMTDASRNVRDSGYAGLGRVIASFGRFPRPTPVPTQDTTLNWMDVLIEELDPRGVEVPRRILDHFLMSKMKWKEPEWSVRCAYMFPAVVLTLGKTGWDDLRPLYITLCMDMHFEVRLPLAASLHLLAKFLGPEITQRDLAPIFDHFLGDSEGIRSAILENLASFMSLLSNERRLSYLPLLSRILLGTRDTSPSNHASCDDSGRTTSPDVLGVSLRDPTPDTAHVIDHPLHRSTSFVSTINTNTELLHCPTRRNSVEIVDSPVPSPVTGTLSSSTQVYVIDHVGGASEAPAMRFGSQAPEKWRIREMVAKNLGELGCSFGFHDGENPLLPLIARSLRDPFAAVRDATVHSFAVMLTSLQLQQFAADTSGCHHVIFGELLALVGDPSFQLRVCFIKIAERLAFTVEKAWFASHVLPSLVRLGRDPISNVRIALARCLETITKIDQYRVDKPDCPQLLVQLSEDLVADKDSTVSSFVTRTAAILGQLASNSPGFGSTSSPAGDVGGGRAVTVDEITDGTRLASMQSLRLRHTGEEIASEESPQDRGPQKSAGGGSMSGDYSSADLTSTKSSRAPIREGLPGSLLHEPSVRQPLANEGIGQLNGPLSHTSDAPQESSLSEQPVPLGPDTGVDSDPNYSETKKGDERGPGQAGVAEQGLEEQVSLPR